MDELLLDGNSAAGLLQQVFAVETTMMVGTCAGCGAAEPMGAAQVFHGAGVVMRCPHCSQALMTVVSDSGRMWLGFSGLRTLEVFIPPS